MKRFLQTISLVVFMGAVGSAFGNLYVDIDRIGETVRFGGPAVTGVFDIVNDDGGRFDRTGYDPSVEHVTRAYAAFIIGDDRWFEGERETVNIDLGSLDFLDASGRFGFGAIGDRLQGNMLVTLSDTGQITYNIESGEGDFRVYYAKLFAYTERGPSTTGSRVPDGGATLALLGFSLLGVACARRK